MRRQTFTALLLCVSWTVSYTGQSERSTQAWTFENPDDATAFVATITGEAQRWKGAAKLDGGSLTLLESWWQSTASVAFAATAEQHMKHCEVQFALNMTTGIEGFGFAWLDVVEFQSEGPAPTIDAWEAPSIARSFGIGFDASNPVNRDPFRGSGNIYDRPQHEVSLHWDGMEIVKRTTPMDFRDGQMHHIEIAIYFVPGGANISLHIDHIAIYKDFFIPSMTAYIGRAAFGARNAETAGSVRLDDLSITYSEPIPAPAAPLNIIAFARVLNDHTHTTNQATIEFPQSNDKYARITCTLKLEEPAGGFDPWDRSAHVFIDDDAGDQVELIRYITPYHKGHTWRIDVTDFRPLLTGSRRIVQDCVTYGTGWLVSVEFHFYEGASDRLAYKVINLWNGAPEIGNPDNSASNFYVLRELHLDELAIGAKVRTVVTGHGMSPNSQNAAEFMPISRTITVNGKEHRNLLWKTDNYLNPCRPQGGTWKYDRAGWAPGDVVAPWEIDVSHIVNAEERTLTIAYVLDDYVNEHRGKTSAPNHLTHAQLILYRAP